MALHSFFANRFTELIKLKKYPEIVFAYQKYIQEDNNYEFLGTGAITTVIRALGKMGMLGWFSID